MLKLKKLIGTLLIGTMCFSFISISSYAATTKNNSSNNPYVQLYLDEKNNKPNVPTKDYLVDPNVEEQIIISALNDYYAEDKEVANVLKKYINDFNLERDTLATKKDGKITTMRNIEKIYSHVKNYQDQIILKGYLERYARSSNDEVSLAFLDKLTPPVKTNNIKNILDKQRNKSISVLSSSYNGTYNYYGAADWAYNNYSYYNPRYPAFNNGYGSDCTNFVSQAMHEGGGMPMQGNWYCFCHNTTYPSPANATQLNYSWSLADPSPWVSVKEFESFWRARANASYVSTSYYASNHSSIYAGSTCKGDVVILHKGISDFITVPTHCMIISAYSDGNADFLMAAHSNPRKDYALLLAIQDYAEIEFIEF